MFLPDGKPDTPLMWNLGVWSLAQEDIAGESSEGEEAYAAVRVGEKLRRPFLNSREPQAQ